MGGRKKNRLLQAYYMASKREAVFDRLVNWKARSLQVTCCCFSHRPDISNSLSIIGEILAQVRPHPE